MRKKQKIIILLFFSVASFIIYSFIVIISLENTSKHLQRKFVEYELEGKNIQEAVKILGEPSKIEYEFPKIIDENNNIEYLDPYIRMTYHTDNILLNKIGYFPGGGTRILADDSSKITDFKTYLY